MRGGEGSIPAVAVGVDGTDDGGGGRWCDSVARRKINGDYRVEPWKTEDYL